MISLSLLSHSFPHISSFQSFPICHCSIFPGDLALGWAKQGGYHGGKAKTVARARITKTRPPSLCAQALPEAAQLLAENSIKTSVLTLLQLHSLLLKDKAN
jgi:hypothetical protein